MTIGDIIREHRLQRNMTQEDVAMTVGTTKPTVSRWENGEISKIKLEMAKKLSKVLDIDLSMFVFTNEVLFPGEYSLINSYREADEGTKTAVRKLLEIGEFEKEK